MSCAFRRRSLPPPPARMADFASSAKPRGRRHALFSGSKTYSNDSYMFSKNEVDTGNVRPGAVTTGALSKYLLKRSESMVADINTNFSGGKLIRRRCSGTSRSNASAKSESKLRSCTSSSKTCVTPFKYRSPCNRLRRIPTVQNVNFVELRFVLLSPLT